MRKPTYGEKMMEFERQLDESYWKQRYEDAVNQIDRDYVRIEELIKEAIADEYDLPFTKDSRILDILNKCLEHKS